jgi:hypothetical protein
MGDKSKTIHMGLDGLIKASQDAVSSAVEGVVSAVKSAVKPKHNKSSSGSKGRYGKKSYMKSPGTGPKTRKSRRSPVRDRRSKP